MQHLRPPVEGDPLPGPKGGIAANGPLPAAAAVLYRGDVMHARLNPFGHRFAYRVFNLLIDLDRLEEADRLSPLFGVNRFAVLSFHEADHRMDGAGPLRDEVDRLLADAGLGARAARVLLLAYPRILGAVFNPICVYFAYDASNMLVAAIYEVRNTFGQRHSYVAKVEAGELSDAGLRQHRAKLFHVSPFVGMDAAYDFRLLPPGDRVRVRIMETENGKPLLSATLVGTKRALTTRGLLAEMLRAPLLTLKVVGGIHYEALKLWLKGARYHSIPEPPVRASFVSGVLPSVDQPASGGTAS
ncbi:MAG: DUF1365 domain-containing protein [Rhizobiaceae bacterium]|jgi:hypothetical protein|nr:DUF1365 domain-containing protein [Rhizobiaceae bacterium]